MRLKELEWVFFHSYCLVEMGSLWVKGKALEILFNTTCELETSFRIENQVYSTVIHLSPDPLKPKEYVATIEKILYSEDQLDYRRVAWVEDGSVRNVIWKSLKFLEVPTNSARCLELAQQKHQYCSTVHVFLPIAYVKNDIIVGSTRSSWQYDTLLQLQNQSNFLLFHSA